MTCPATIFPRTTNVPHFRVSVHWRSAPSDTLPAIWKVVDVLIPASEVPDHSSREVIEQFLRADYRSGWAITALIAGVEKAGHIYDPSRTRWDFSYIPSSKEIDAAAAALDAAMKKNPPGSHQ